VDLVVHGIGAFVAQVRHAQDGVADLDLLPAIPAGFLDGRPATMVAMGERRFQGTVELGWSLGHVRFVRKDVQRRAWTRAEIEHPAIILPDSLDGVWRTQTRDISAGGALLAHAEALPLGMKFELLIDVQDDDQGQLRAPGRVIRAPGAGLRAVRFEDVGPAERLRLARLVAVQHVKRPRD
jgi:hypothetical protein